MIVGRTKYRALVESRVKSRIFTIAASRGWECRYIGDEADLDAALDFIEERLAKTASFEDVQRLQEEAIDGLKVVADKLGLGAGLLTEIVPAAMNEVEFYPCPMKQR